MNYQEAINKAQTICSKQEKCRQDIFEKLLQWNVDETIAIKILDQLEKERFISESRYASAFARDKLRFNKWGKIKISWILKQKKIPSHIISEALDSISEDEYTGIVSDVLSGKLKSLKGKNILEKKMKLTRFAQQRGFEFDVIGKIVNDLIK